MVMLASIFRDSTSYLDRYFAQVNALRVHVPVQLWLAEGDSRDGTNLALYDHTTVNDVVIHVDHGGPRFESVDHPQRWNQIATVCNTLLDKLPFGQPLIYVESDLIWEPETMLTLLADLTTVDAVAPQSLKGDRFYDTWGHRWPDGSRFDGLVIPEDGGLQPISSAGSCIAMRPEVYRDCRFGENDGIVGFGRDLHFKGYSLFLDPSVHVEHP